MSQSSGTEISCIVPVYNGERYLAEALDSIMRQTLRPAQVIVVDDGSTDGSADIARGYGDRITYLQQPNAGPASARNRGIRHATCDYISFLDADDLWHEDKLTRQLDALHANPDAGICVTYLQNFWVEELAHERERMRDHAFAKPMPGYVCQCLLARREVFETVGSFDEGKRIGEDTDWYVRVARAGVGKVVLDDALVFRRIHGQNISYEVYQSTKARDDVLDLVMSSLRHKRSQQHSS